MDRRFAFEPEEKIRLPEAAGLGEHRVADAAVDIFRFNDALQYFPPGGELTAADGVHKAEQRVAADEASILGGGEYVGEEGS